MISFNKKIISEGDALFEPRLEKLNRRIEKCLNKNQADKARELLKDHMEKYEALYPQNRIITLWLYNLGTLTRDPEEKIKYPVTVFRSGQEFLNISQNSHANVKTPIVP